MNPAIQFHRPASLQQLESISQWDIVVIGGGATGLGTALDASSRGFRTLLLEQADFSKGTSSRSTKLVHGGVRYLAQGNIKLVYDALHERGILLRNAPHLVKAQPFIIPCFSRLGVIKYLAGLTLYDWLAGRFSFGKSGYLRKKEVVASLPHIDPKKLKGGVRYFDGQFDDARLAINLAQTCAEQGAVLINYMRVTGLLKEHGAVSSFIPGQAKGTGPQLLREHGAVSGVTATDLETGKSYSIKAKAVVNATGVFVDDILRMDEPGIQPLVRPSQGIHLVFDRSILDSEAALMIPQTSDGRVLFAVPWHGHVLVGTTDTPLNEHSLEPQALNREVEFIMQTLRQYLSVKPSRNDVLSVFAGLRPLAAPKNNSSSTKEISRDHKLMVSASGLITITGGKWTTYRKMAEDTVNHAIAVAHLPAVESRTRELPVHGSPGGPLKEDHLSVYGSDAVHIRALMNEDASWSRKLHERLPYTAAEALWAVRHEMARTVEDVLARRLRALFLDARAAMEMAPAVADILVAELHYNEEWKQGQVAAFKRLAEHYLLSEG